MASSSVSSDSKTIRSKWLKSVAMFIQETQTNSLYLANKNMDASELEFLAKYLSNSKITDLILGQNDLSNMRQVLPKLIASTKLRKLDVSLCELNNEDLFHLFKSLKDKQITELDIVCNELTEFSTDEQNKFISFMQESGLKIFNFDITSCFLNSGHEALIFQALSNSTITKLSLEFGADNDTLTSLFSNLGCSSLTELRLYDAEFDQNMLKKLSQSLGDSKLETLSITDSQLDDSAVDILVEGLVQSKITVLNLISNKIKGSNILGLKLKDTCIKTLNLSHNKMEQHGIFLSPDFLASSSITELYVCNCQLDDEFCQKLLKHLRFSKVTKLGIAGNFPQAAAISKFAQIVKDTNLEEVDFSCNNLSSDALVVFGECIKASKLSHVHLSSNKFTLDTSITLGECMKVSNLSHVDLSSCFKHTNAETLLPAFLSEIKGSSIYSIKLSFNKLNENVAKALAVQLRNTTLTHLDLSWNQIGNGIISIAEHLKFSTLASLRLYGNEITDEGAEALAKHLNETQLIDLDLRDNHITDRGAAALASALCNSSLLHLQLCACEKIGNNGIESLARGAENTFITVLSVPCDLGEPNDKRNSSFLLLESVLLRNKISVERLVNVFKEIAPQQNNNIFCFDGISTSTNVDTFLENCLELYMKIIIQKPSAVRVLLEEKSISHSKAEIISLMSEEFPKQFCQFVASRVEADVKQHVSLLKSAEEKGLSKVVELLLLNRPLYLLDEDQGILHPYVYQLLNNYNLPLFNLDVEPDAKDKIINYFTEHSDMEGASDVIRLLRGKRKHSNPLLVKSHSEV